MPQKQLASICIHVLVRFSRHSRTRAERVHHSHAVMYFLCTVVYVMYPRDSVDSAVEISSAVVVVDKGTVNVQLHKTATIHSVKTTLRA